MARFRLLNLIVEKAILEPKHVGGVLERVRHFPILFGIPELAGA